MTDWQAIRTAICEGRRFTPTGQGAKVLADTIMPSGLAIHVHIESRHDCLFLHDGGAAFDELVRHGLNFSRITALRRMLRETNFGASDDGLIFRERVPLDNVATGIAIMADASFRAATYMLDRADKPQARHLDQQVKDALHLRYPQGRPNFVIEGKNRQHIFDFGVTLNDETVVVEAVTPEPASVNAAIVKALDVAQAREIRARAVFVIDNSHDQWKSSQLSLLQLGGTPILIDRLNDNISPLAA